MPVKVQDCFSNVEEVKNRIERLLRRDRLSDYEIHIRAANTEEKRELKEGIGDYFTDFDAEKKYMEVALDESGEHRKISQMVQFSIVIELTKSLDRF